MSNAYVGVDAHARREGDGSGGGKNARVRTSGFCVVKLIRAFRLATAEHMR